MSENTATRVAVVGGVRTPFGRAGTVFKKRSALNLAVHSVNGLLQKQRLDPQSVDELVYGIVVVDPRIPHLAREVVFSSQLPPKVRSTIGGPSFIVRQVAALHIQAGSSRENPGRSSTRRTSLPLRRAPS